MGLLAEFDIIADFGFKTETPTVGIPIYYDDGMEEFETVFMDTIEELCPVDTGFLHDSIQVETTDTTVKVWTDCEYAQYVEYGTWKQDPQPYFEPPVAAALNAATHIWNDAMEEALEEEAEELEEQREGVDEEEEGEPISEGDGPLGGSISALLGITIALTIIETIKEMFDTSDVVDYGKEEKKEKRKQRRGRSFKGEFKGKDIFSFKVFMPTIIIT